MVRLDGRQQWWEGLYSGQSSGLAPGFRPGQSLSADQQLPVCGCEWARPLVAALMNAGFMIGFGIGVRTVAAGFTVGISSSSDVWQGCVRQHMHASHI